MNRSSDVSISPPWMGSASSALGSVGRAGTAKMSTVRTVAPLVRSVLRAS